MTEPIMKYFVLKPRSKKKGDPYAKASRQAMRAFAMSIKIENPELANSLYEWADTAAKEDVLL